MKTKQEIHDSVLALIVRAVDSGRGTLALRLEDAVRYGSVRLTTEEIATLAQHALADPETARKGWVNLQRHAQALQVEVAAQELLDNRSPSVTAGVRAAPVRFWTALASALEGTR